MIDMKGIDAIANKGRSSLREKTNLCNVVACSILGNEPCTDMKLQSLMERTVNITDEKELGNVDVSAKILNKREDTRPINLTDYQWDEIEKSLLEYDCGFQKTLLASPLLRILFQHSIFAACNADFEQRTMSWLVEKIESIANGESNSEMM